MSHLVHRVRQRRFTGITERAFTVIELMLAIAVIAILSAIAIPTYQQYELKVQDAQAQKDITEIEERISLYYQINQTLPQSLSQVNEGSVLDPWGNPYHYLDFTGLTNISQVRKDRNLIPLNTDYDLFSTGPNGAWQAPITAKSSRDDIIRANNGAYVGLASDY